MQKLVDLPSKSKQLGYKWIFQRKMKDNGTIDKYKIKLVVKGFKQQERVNYFDTFICIKKNFHTNTSSYCIH